MPVSCDHILLTGFEDVNITRYVFIIASAEAEKHRHQTGLNTSSHLNHLFGSENES